jgi:hypothetical protein
MLYWYNWLIFSRLILLVVLIIVLVVVFLRDFWGVRNA